MLLLRELQFIWQCSSLYKLGKAYSTRVERCQMMKVCVLAVPHAPCENASKSHTFHGPSFLHLQNGDNKI